MPGPGEYRPDPSQGITRIEDLPKPKIRCQSRNYRRRPCPRCGQSAYRDRRVRRTLHDLGNPLTGRPRELIVIYSQHCCTRCRKYFNADMTDLADPVVTLPSALSTRPSAWSSRTAYRIAPPVGACGAITASSFLTPRSRTGSRTGGKAQRRIPTDYLDWALSDFSGYIAADELYDGPFCVLSIVDNRTFKRLSYHVLDRDPTQVDIEAFFRRFRQALEARGLTVQGITTDGSTLYPNRSPQSSVRCRIRSANPHPARGEQGDPLGRGPGTQASGSRCPQIAAGPSQLKGGQACRWVQEADQAEGG